MTTYRSYESDEFEDELEFEDEFEDSGAFELFGEQDGELEDSEELELALAHELLAVTNEEELEEFLGKLVKGAGKFLKSKVGKTVTGVLRGVAKTALPMVGSALGSFVLPGVGTAIGGKLGSMASKLLEAEEAELLGEAEAEFEAARRFVRFGRATVRYAAAAPRSAPPRTVARSAAVAAARRHAPALLRNRPARPVARPSRRRGQRWSAQQRRRRPARWQWDPGPGPWSGWSGSWPAAVPTTYVSWGDDASAQQPDWDDPDPAAGPYGTDGDDAGGFDAGGFDT